MSGTTTFVVTSEAQLNAAISAIDNGGTDSAVNTAYYILLTGDFTLSSSVTAIDLAAGDTLSIQGDNAGNDNYTAQIDSNGARGFVVNAGSVTLTNMSLTGMRAPGGTGGTPAGGGALYVGAGAAVTASAVSFNGDSASGGTPAGGAVFVAQGGSLAVSTGSVGGGGNIPGSGIFIQGNNSITLANTTITGAIADQTGSQLGIGTGSVVTQGTVTLDAKDSYTGGTTDNGTLTLAAAGASGTGPITVNGTLVLSAVGAAGSGTITFGAPTGDTLIVDAGDTPAGTLDGFVPNPGTGSANSNVIDLQGIGVATTATLSAGNHLTVFGSAATVTLNLNPTVNYAADSFVPQADAAAGTQVTVVQSGFLVASEADLNAALAQIEAGGKSYGPNVAYSITLTAGFTLTSDISAIDLGTGDTLTVNGAGYTIDGGGAYRGFLDYAGGLTLENLTLQNAVASGGAGGTGLVPGGGGAGLGGGLFVASGGAATLANVTFLNDSAIGGIGGALGTTGVGGGGGLGGAGGWAVAGAHNPLDGGGGGIGLAAVGGSASGGTGQANGGPGIIPGGGGGNAGNTKVTHTGGSGRGGGGSRTIYTPIPATPGGLPGFGGGAASGSAAGLGGGGAGSAGGFGGGGSGANAGGFGGGGGVANGAGGGLGAGGDVFVQQGGLLTIAAGSLSGGVTAGGVGSNGGGTGSALGTGIFEQGGGVTLAPAAGQTLTIADTIAEPGGNGSASLTVNGPGTVTLSATNSYTGGTTLDGGTLSLQASGAAGGGMIVFGYGMAATLIAGAGDVPANVIGGFLPGDVIDLQGIGTATSATPSANNVLAISGGTIPVLLNLDPAQNLTGETFNVVSDNAGGTLLTATDINGDTPPLISGTGTVAGNDHTAFSPFAGVTVSDLDPGQTETVTVTQSSLLNGVLSNLGGGSYDPVAGVYSVSGTTAQVTAALDGLVFTPTIYQVAPGHVVSTRFALSATDGMMFAPATAETANITALNDPPVINGVGFGVVEGYWNVPLNPFPTAAIVDPDVGASETVTFSVGGTGTLSLPSTVTGVTLTTTGPGVYTLSAASPALATAAADALQFTTGPNPSVPGYTINYVYMSVSDGIAPAVTARAEVLTGLPVFTGVTPDQTIVDGTSGTPFSTVGVTDSAGLTIQGMSITVFDSSSDYLNPTDANGILSGAGLTKVGVGTYTLALGNGDPAFVTAELQGLVFTPPISNTTVTTDFNLSAFDGATTSDNGNTSVIAVPGPAVATISGTAGGQPVSDNATIAPFATVAISDSNPPDSATISLIDAVSGTISGANGNLSGAGLTETSPGIYALTATDPATLSTELDALVFTPTSNEAPPGSGVTTNFALSVTDANGTITDNTTSVTAIPSAVVPVIAGTASGQLVADGTTLNPFSTVTITDSNPNPSDNVAITVNDISAGLMITTPSDADGTLSFAASYTGPALLTHTGVGTWTVSIAPAAAADPVSISTALDALVFTPTPGLVTGTQTVNTSFYLTVADNLAAATDYNTSVTITAGTPPTIALDPVGGTTNTVDAARMLAGFAFTGTTTGVEDGQTVWVLVSGLAFSGTVTGGTWSASVSPARAAYLAADGTYTAYAYVTNAAGVTSQTVSEDFTIDLAGYFAATPSISPATLNFGAVRVGNTAVTQSVTIANGSTVNPDQSPLSYAIGTLPAGLSDGATASGALTSGTSATVGVTMATGTPEMFANTPLPVTLTSVAPTGSGLTDTALPSGTLLLSGKVYAPAIAQVSANAFNFGVVHVGDAVTRSLVVTNAAAGALTDVLTGAFGSVSSNFTGTGTLGAGLAAGVSTSLTIGLKTTSSGTFSGTAALNMASHDADLANLAVPAGPVTLSGVVDNYAVAVLKKVSGTGTLTQSGTNYQLSLGMLATGSTAPAITFGASNAATGLADLLSGGFTVAPGAGFTNTGFASFSGLAAGQTDSANTVTLSTAATGSFSETITLTSAGSNASSYSAALPTETLTITATVATPVYTLTTGVDTVKAGSGNSTIVAASNTLSSGDSITGGSGATTLVLTGGGVFNLTSPSTLSAIQLITAQEGQGATAQTVTLRPGLNATVNVAPDTGGDSSPGITIVGMSNSDVINLGSGNDTVTLGAGETVNGGGGNNTFNVTAATIKSTIHGGTGTNTLVVNGGGTATMGSAITGIATVNLSGTTTFTANATNGLKINGSAAGGDVITLGAPGQSVTAAGANELVKATAANAGDQVAATGTNSTLEITSGGAVTLNAATNVTTVKLDSATVLQLNGIAFITAVGNSNGGDTITAGGINQTLSGGKADTLVGYSGGFDTFLDKSSAINGDTIGNFGATDKIDLTDLAFAGAKLAITAGAQSTVVKATSGTKTTSFTLVGSFTASGFGLATDGGTGTVITHS